MNVNATLTLDDSASYNLVSRLNTAIPITLNGGSFGLLGNNTAGALSAEPVGPITLNSGESTMFAESGSALGALASLTSVSLTRMPGATVYFAPSPVTAAVLTGVAGLNQNLGTTGDQINFGINAVQTLTFGAGNTGGTFTLTFNGQTTTPITYSTTLATLQANILAGLAALSMIGSPNTVSVNVSSTTSATVTFVGALSEAPQAAMTGTPSLMGGANTLTVATTTPGVNSFGAQFRAGQWHFPLRDGGHARRRAPGRRPLRDPRRYRLYQLRDLHRHCRPDEQRPTDDRGHVSEQRGDQFPLDRRQQRGDAEQLHADHRQRRLRYDRPGRRPPPASACGTLDFGSAEGIIVTNTVGGNFQETISSVISGSGVPHDCHPGHGAGHRGTDPHRHSQYRHRQ